MPKRITNFFLKKDNRLKKLEPVMSHNNWKFPFVEDALYKSRELIIYTPRDINLYLGPYRQHPYRRFLFGARKNEEDFATGYALLLDSNFLKEEVTETGIILLSRLGWFDTKDSLRLYGLLWDKNCNYGHIPMRKGDLPLIPASAREAQKIVDGSFSRIRL